LLDLGFATETSLNIVGLVNDTHAVAIERDSLVAKQEEKETLSKESSLDKQTDTDILGE